jgi:hypothetical protein
MKSRLPFLVSGRLDIKIRKRPEEYGRTPAQIFLDIATTK